VHVRGAAPQLEGLAVRCRLKGGEVCTCWRRRQRDTRTSPHHLLVEVRLCQGRMDVNAREEAQVGKQDGEQRVHHPAHYARSKPAGQDAGHHLKPARVSRGAFEEGF